MKVNILKTATDEELQALLNKSTTLSQILRHYSLSESCTYYRRILNERMKNLDLSIYESNRSKVNIFDNQWRKHEEEDLFVENSSVCPSTIRRRLKNIKAPNACDVCNMPPIWNGQPLKLQLDHINGNKKDNRVLNLRWICPNCHSQTDTYTGKNRYKV